MIVDVHTHAFPDKLAERAMAALTAEVEEGITAYLDGRVESLLQSMDRAGIDAAVVASIATRPKQFAPILEWSREIASSRLLPFPSLHPEDPEAASKVDLIADAGFKGVKLHPYYQCFEVDEERLSPIYERLQARGLVLLSHTGFDIAYPRDRIADPVRVRRVIEAFPKLHFIASHLGAWEDWDEVEAYLIGQPVYLDVSFVHDYLGADRMRSMIMAHRLDYLLFGSDSPWDDQQRALDNIRALELPPEREQALFGGNARRLLGLG